MADEPVRAIYAIGAVERILGQSESTIHEWEQRFGLPVPPRSPGGMLLYTRDDIERLQLIALKIAAGSTPSTTRPDAPRSADDDAPRVLVLLAERDRHAADLEEFFLRTEGYDVAVTLDAKHVEAAYDATRPSVAIVDLSLAGHAGLEVCRRLAARGDAPVIAVSTLSLRDDAFAAGAVAFLPRPIEPLALVSAVKDLLGASAFLRRAEPK